MSAHAKDFEDYLYAVSEPARTTLEQVRREIRTAVPQAVETISYRMPTLEYRGKGLLGPSASKDHCSLHLMGYIPTELERPGEISQRGPASVDP